MVRDQQSQPLTANGPLTECITIPLATGQLCLGGGRSGAAWSRAGDCGEECADGGAQVGGGQLPGPGPGDLVEEQAVEAGHEVGWPLGGVADAGGGGTDGGRGTDRACRR